MEEQLKSRARDLFKSAYSKCMLLMALTILATAFSMNSYAQQAITVTGKVTDDKGQPVSGVNVAATGTPRGTSTNASGVFTIQASPTGSLTFTGVGFETQTVPVNGKTTIDVSMVQVSVQLEDMVVVGYGIQKRKDLTGSITSVKLENTPKATVPFVNPLEAIQGTAGINIGPSAGAGATPNVVVRGQNSISASTNPLLVVDGVIFNGSLIELNMNDIATFDILKDASSAAIYGSRSANGVIIITTKRGRTEKPTINFNTYYGAQSWTRTPKVKRGADFLRWRKDNLAIRGNDTSDIAKVLNPLELQAYKEGRDMDWLDEVTQYAPIQNYSLSVAGRTKNLNYYLSGSFTNQKGVLFNDNFKKPTLTLKLENNITDWLTVGLNAYYSSRDLSGIAPDLYMATYMSPFSYKYVGGSQDTILQRYPAGTTSLFNPFWGNPNVSQPGYYDDNLEKYTNTRATGFVNVKLPFIKGLNYRFSFTGSRATSEFAYFHHEFAEINTTIPSDILNPAQFLSRANGYTTTAATKSWVLDNILSYTKSFGDHNFDALVGYTRDNSDMRAVRFNSSNYANAGTTALGYNGLQYGFVQSGATRDSVTANIGYIGRLNYNYKERYYATLNFRRDGYSAFAEGHKMGTFPGASVAWAISEENFMKNVRFVDGLKLRASYGRTGNQGILPYSTKATVALDYTVFGSTTTPFSNQIALANPLLSWEKTTSLNLGLDYSLFKNRITGNVEVYRSTTTDQLLTRSLPAFPGITSVQTNDGEVQNKGIEVSINTVNVKAASGFTWSSGFSFWMNRNKLVHLYGMDVNKDGKEDDDLGNSLFIGKSLGAIFDYTSDGVVQKSDVAYIASTGLQPGDMKFRDISGPNGVPDGKITTLDRSVIGYAKENFNMNLSNTFSYKNFSFYFSVNAIIGGGKNNFFMSTNTRSLNPGAVTSNVANWIDQDYWMPNKENSEFPRPNYTNPLAYGFYQSRTFARLQNLSLSYNIPKEMLDKLKISNLKLYISGTNLITITGWTGLDPANGAQIGGNGGSTVSTNPTNPPLMRSVTAGVNLSF